MTRDIEVSMNFYERAIETSDLYNIAWIQTNCTYTLKIDLHSTIVFVVLMHYFWLNQIMSNLIFSSTEKRVGRKIPGNIQLEKKGIHWQCWSSNLNGISNTNSKPTCIWTVDMILFGLFLSVSNNFVLNLDHTVWIKLPNSYIKVQ